MNERDPHGLDASAPGAKLDADKVQADLLLDFSRALTAVAEVGTYGAKKYSRGGWQHVPNASARYSAAMLRHLLAMGAGETADQESELDHMAHFAWNALAWLELRLRSAEVKDSLGVVPERRHWAGGC